LLFHALATMRLANSHAEVRKKVDDKTYGSMTELANIPFGD
jgi:hypothetical protein